MFNMKENTDVKEIILQEAQKLFIDKGFKGTSIRDIAKASETNVAMVNYYFQSKYNLFEIVFEEALDVFTKRIFETLSVDLSFSKLIESWVNIYYEILFQHPQIATFILNEVRLNPEALTNRIKNKNPYGFFNQIDRRIQSEVQKGIIRETPTADFLLNVLSLCMFPFLFGNLAKTLMEIPQEIYDGLIANHKKYVIEFITNALTPDDKGKGNTNQE